MEGKRKYPKSGFIVCTFLSYRYYKYLSANMYYSKQLESTFIEILRQGKSMIVGCIYKHSNMSIKWFYKVKFFANVGKQKQKKKKGVLLGDFNINLDSNEKGR